MKGFTILETVIVIAVMMILSGTLLGYNRSSERQIVLYRDRAAIVGLLNRAKTLTIEKYNQIVSGYTACAFGLHFAEPRTIILFQDLVSSAVPNACASHSVVYDSGANPTEIMESLTLDNRLRFSGNFDIAFIAPDVKATTTANEGAFPVLIDLQLNDGSLTAPVTVSAAGQISQ